MRAAAGDLEESHVPSSIDAAGAVAAVRGLHDPGEVRLGPGTTAECLWIPMAAPDFTSLPLALEDRTIRLPRLDFEASRLRPGPPRQGGVRIPADSAAANVSVPIWVVRGPEAAFALVEGDSGEVLEVDVPAHLWRARLRLVIQLVLGAHAAFAAAGLIALGGVLANLLVLQIGFLLPITVPLTIGVGLGLWLGIGYAVRLERFELRLFTEPLHRAVTGRIRGGARAGPLLGLFGRLTLAGAFALPIAAALRASGGGAVDARQAALTTLLMVAVGAGALVLARRQGATTVHTAPPDELPAGPWAEMTQMTLLATRYVLAALLMWLVLHQSGATAMLFTAFDEPVPGPGELRTRLLELAAIAATVRGKLSPGRRWPLLAGLLASFAVKHLGVTAALGASMAAVSLAAWLVRGRGPWDAVKQALRFELGGAVGRIVGRVSLGLLLGPGGIVIGEVLGRQLAGALSLSPTARPDELPLPEGAAQRTGYFRWSLRIGALVVLSLTIVGSLRETRLVLPRVNTESWVEFQPASGRFAASLPAIPTESELTWPISNHGVRPPDAPAPPALALKVYETRAAATRLLIVDGAFPASAARSEWSARERLLHLELQKFLELDHLGGYDRWIYVGVDRASRDVRCVYRIADERFLVACAEGGRHGRSSRSGGAALLLRPQGPRAGGHDGAAGGAAEGEPDVPGDLADIFPRRPGDAAPDGAVSLPRRVIVEQPYARAP